MALTAISQAPAVDDFTALEEHQEQTPQTFFGSKPVLHLRSEGAKVHGRREEVSGIYEFAELLKVAKDGAEEGEVDVEADVWVTSRYKSRKNVWLERSR